MNHRSFNEYVQKVQDAIRANPEWRLGQAYFNVLHNFNPPIAEMVRATAIDPYNQDNRIDAFLEFVLKELDREDHESLIGGSDYAEDNDPHGKP